MECQGSDNDSGATCGAQTGRGESNGLTASPSSPPAARYGAAMAFDGNASDEYVVLFSGSSQNDTWTYADGSWTRLDLSPGLRPPNDAPPPRVGASMTYDARDGYVLLFGGEEASPGSTYLTTTYYRDTWTFLHGVWTNITPATPSATNSPSPRYDASMTYDYQDGYVVLFGGDYERTFLSDTWMFQDGAWTNITATAGSAPSCRFGAGMVDDPADGFVLLFGGDTKQPGGCGAATLNLTSNQSWSFVEGRWTFLNLSSNETPPASWLACMVFDSRDGYVLLFGGILVTNMAQQQTWIFANGGWSQLYTPTFPPTSPPARFGANIANISGTNGYVLLYGGLSEPQKNAPALGDVWTYLAGVWTNLTPIPTPSVRSSMAMTYDEKDGYVLLFGGYSASGPLSDTWKYVGGVWFELTPPQSPPARYGASMAYDGRSGDDYVVLFGGMGVAGILGDTWTFLRGEWLDITSSTGAKSPSPRFDAVMAFDASAEVDKIVLFGGEDATGFLGDTWTFVNGSWSQPSQSFSPAARAGASFAYDGASGTHYLLLFGGFAGFSILGDTWEFAGPGQWSPVATTGPAPRYAASLAYDSTDGYLLLYGGANATSYFGDSWKFVHGSWTELTVALSPPGRCAAGMAYDITDSLALLFSGAGSGITTSDLQNNTWVFSGTHNWTQASQGPEQASPADQCAPDIGPNQPSSAHTLLGIFGLEGLVLLVGLSVLVVLTVIMLRNRRGRAPPDAAETPEPTAGTPPR